jgi:regulator of ribonuclease activity A
MRATTDLYDDFEDSCETCSIQFRDFGGRNAFFGRIRTVKCFHDNVLFRELLNEPGEGDVIVVDGGGSTAIALMGDMLAARARDNGWAGVIINGAPLGVLRRRRSSGLSRKDRVKPAFHVNVTVAASLLALEQ